MNKLMLYKILGPLLFLSTLFLNPPDEMTESGFRLLGIILWMAVWWISEVVPIAVTSLLPIILFPSLTILNIQNTGANYGHKYIFLLKELFFPLDKLIITFEIHDHVNIFT